MNSRFFQLSKLFYLNGVMQQSYSHPSSTKHAFGIFVFVPKSTQHPVYQQFLYEHEFHYAWIWHSASSAIFCTCSLLLYLDWLPCPCTLKCATSLPIHYYLIANKLQIVTTSLFKLLHINIYWESYLIYLGLNSLPIQTCITLFFQKPSFLKLIQIAG